MKPTRTLALVLLLAAVLPSCAQAELLPVASQTGAISYEQKSIEEKQQALQTDIAEVTQEIESVDKKIEAAPVSLPVVYGVSLALIPDAQIRTATQQSSQQYYAEGRPDKAASVIGRALGAANNYSLFFLGNFCLTALPTAGDADAQLAFISGFMRGYSKCGVLVFTTAAVKRYTVYPLKMGEPWSSVPPNAASAAPGQRVYVGKGLVFVPFAYGSKFKVDIVSKAGADVRMWKVMPEGVNEKNWQGGNWEKEISVRGDVKF